MVFKRNGSFWDSRKGLSDKKNSSHWNSRRWISTGKNRSHWNSRQGFTNKETWSDWKSRRGSFKQRKGAIGIPEKIVRAKERIHCKSRRGVANYKMEPPETPNMLFKKWSVDIPETVFSTKLSATEKNSDGKHCSEMEIVSRTFWDRWEPPISGKNGQKRVAGTPNILK